MSRKVYQCLGYLSYSHSLRLKEGTKYVQFTGGTRVPKRRFGLFVTEDKEIQKALEKDPLFNKSFKLIKIDDELIDKPKEELTIEQQLEKAREVNANLLLDIDKLKEGTTDISPELEAAKDQVGKYKAQVEVLTGTVKSQKEAIEALESKVKGTSEKKEEGNVNDPDVDIADGPKNMQAARQYLIKKHGQDIKTMKNGEDVRAVAKKIGVQFPNWHWKA